MEILKYPIGRFDPPQNIDKNDRSQWIEILEELPGKLKTCVLDWTEQQFDTPYREGAWTVRQLVHHIADSHMNSLTRFKWGMTEDTPTIKTYREADWAELPDALQLHPSVSMVLLEQIHIRLVTLLKGLQDEDFERMIVHPEMGVKMSLHSLLAMYAWHSEHHLAQIEQLKRQKKW